MADNLAFSIMQMSECVSPCPDSLQTSAVQTLINLFSLNSSTQPNKHHNFLLPIFIVKMVKMELPNGNNILGILCSIQNFSKVIYL